MKRVRIWLLGLMLLFPTWAQAAVTEEFDVSNGVTYTEIVEEGTAPQSVRVMEIDATDPYTKVKAGVPNPLNKLVQTSKQALAASEEGHEVIGAINGSFFNREPMPLYFVAIDNYLVNGGTVETSKNEFVSQQIAFGMNKEGKGQIDHYSTTFTYSHNGTTRTMAGHNGQRSPDETMIYTPNFSSGITTTNPYGYEVIVDGAGDPSLQFGGTLTGKVTGFRPYGQADGAVIPKNGFVLSAHGKEADALKSMKIGDTVSVSVDVDEKWQGADFMIGSGPLLVRDGKSVLAESMNPNSPKAKEKAPRTAVAIDKTGEKVAFITVDGRQPGYSTGMSLSDFADYIQSLGYDRALNMDGGGSTTMLAREPGDFTATIQNKPSDPWERPVSTFLMAITTAPKGVPTTIDASLSSNAPLEIGESLQVNIRSIMDEYGNPVKVEDVTITSDLGTVSGTTFTAAKSGTGFVSVKKGTAEVKLPITVKAAPESKAVLLDSFEGGGWSISPVSTRAYDGKYSLQVDGTVRPAQPLALTDSPTFVSMRVYGQADGAEVTGTLLDAKGTAHQASFGQVTWNGWKNVRIPVQAGWMKLSALSSTKPGVYVDDVKAVYGTSYQEALFRDVPVSFRAEGDIASLVDRGVISGFPNGTFGPQETLTRVQAAIMLQRAMKLPTDSVKNPNFSDVPKTYAFYGSIAAVTEAGIMFGRTDGTFDAQAKLTRAEMAAVLARALKLPEANRNYFPDNYAGTFSYSSVNALAASGITEGFPDGTFRPGEPIKRADFSIFLNRGLTKN
ncbi:phosphodiester glycosidase family protein [Domibacillus robiginosus]|uniref:phosphodiester glycosidase family protein n=1 Tax=Domibacillus robiginosus TaxID=1071054 RepID=UPI00067B447D|nr:S-layer homology domain-containing protein [Domibacillus robiginosus]